MDLGLSFGLEWALYTIGGFETLSYFTLTCIFFKYIFAYVCHSVDNEPGVISPKAPFYEETVKKLRDMTIGG